MNDRALALTGRGPTRFFPVCSVHPADGPSALAEVDRVARRGARGLKLHPNTQQFDVADRAVHDVVARATDHGLPVLFDAYSPFDADQPGKFVRLAMEVPKSRLILAHAHGPRFPDLLVYEILSRYDWWGRNVWIDLSATGPLLAKSPFRNQFVWVLRQVGIDRLVFGSDYPLDEPRSAVRAIAGMGFSPRELSRIFYANAVSLFGLD
jgi:predicted TIM-barrel fold metal-dependent hydrolase